MLKFMESYGRTQKWTLTGNANGKLLMIGKCQRERGTNICEFHSGRPHVVAVRLGRASHGDGAPDAVARCFLHDLHFVVVPNSSGREKEMVYFCNNCLCFFGIARL